MSTPINYDYHKAIPGYFTHYHKTFYFLEIHKPYTNNIDNGCTPLINIDKGCTPLLKD